MAASVMMKKNSFENNLKKRKKVMHDNLDDEKRNI